VAFRTVTGAFFPVHLNETKSHGSVTQSYRIASHHDLSLKKKHIRKDLRNTIENVALLGIENLLLQSSFSNENQYYLVLLHFNTEQFRELFQHKRYHANTKVVSGTVIRELVRESYIPHESFVQLLDHLLQLTLGQWKLVH